MVKKKRAGLSASQLTKKNANKKAFLHLTSSQTRSLAIGAIMVGIGLFALMAMTWQNKETLSQSIFPTATVTQHLTPTVLPGESKEATPPSKMISASSTAMLTDKKPLVKKLPNTTSKVTYTVEENDNVATIGQQLCGHERAWLSIVETNNLAYPYIIQPGETYIITCN